MPRLHNISDILSVALLLTSRITVPKSEHSVMADLVKDDNDDTTQVWIVNKEGKTLETNKWHLLPTYRLELTLFHTVRSHQPSRMTTVIKKDYENWDSANTAALELAKSCRSSGESVMLVKRQEGDVDVLHQYAVGIWNWKEDWSGRVPCKWSLIHDWERERWYSHRKGDISGYVTVVRWWKKPLISAYESVAMEDLKSSDDGSPPRGVETLSSYEFMGYRLRNTRTWKPVQLLTPLSWLTLGERAELASLTTDHTLRQFSPHAWRVQNPSQAILGLEKNIETVRLACRKSRDLQMRFIPGGTIRESPTDITWGPSKNSVVTEDLKALEYKLKFLELQEANLAAAHSPKFEPGLKEIETVDVDVQLSDVEDRNIDSVDDETVTQTSSVSSQSPEKNGSALAEACIESTLGEIAKYLILAVTLLHDHFWKSWVVILKFVVFTLMLPGEVEGPTNTERLSDPSICLCTAHQWRRANFPRHKRLPAVPKREQAYQSQVPEWAQDPTFVPRHVQHFISESDESTCKPEPKTLRGYIRRQLETGWPVPRQKYIDFRTMAELDCTARWGPNWRSQDQKEQEEWEGYRNVKRQRCKVSAPKTGEPPEDELWGYDGCLLEHETRCRTLNQLGDNEAEMHSPRDSHWSPALAASMVVIGLAGMFVPHLDILELLWLCNMV